jgi:methyl-CpG-binding domain protein 4
VADDPWKLLVAVTLLNKTSGRCAVPIFWTLIDRWPTPQSLAKGQPCCPPSPALLMISF